MKSKQFKKAVNQVKTFINLVNEKESELKEINRSEYYSKFKQNRNRDINEVLIEKKDALSNLYAKLENLQTAIELLKADVSNAERSTILQRESLTNTSKSC